MKKVLMTEVFKINELEEPVQGKFGFAQPGGSHDLTSAVEKAVRNFESVVKDDFWWGNSRASHDKYKSYRDELESNPDAYSVHKGGKSSPYSQNQVSSMESGKFTSPQNVDLLLTSLKEVDYDPNVAQFQGGEVKNGYDKSWSYWAYNLLNRLAAQPGDTGFSAQVLRDAIRDASNLKLIGR